MSDETGLVSQFKAGRAKVKVYENRGKMGEAAAKAAGEKMIETIAKKGGVSVVLPPRPPRRSFWQT